MGGWLDGWINRPANGPTTSQRTFQYSIPPNAGWEGVGDERRTIAAFLFTWPEGKLNKARPIKLPKIGSAEYAIDDRGDLGIKFGYEDLVIGLGKQRVATSRLGLAYARGPGGMASLFAPSEGRTAEIIDLKVYARKK